MGTTKPDNKKTLSIRLSPDLLSQIKACGKPNKIIEDALIDYLPKLEIKKPL